MFALIDLFKTLFSFTPNPSQDRDDRYLAESTDIYDLERRMREVDSGRHSVYAVGSTGIFTR